MKISFKKTIAKMLCLTTCVTAIATPLLACGSKEDPPLVLATDALDTVFNPFFYTSGADGEIVGQTQIGMLSSDKNGELIANWNEPCVSHAWSYVKHGKPSDVQGNNYNGYQTDYYFALKDNIKFSDGTLLTKNDVLFNLYMYLDPAYTGSNTMYSVKIQGLTEYRTQTEDLNSSTGAEEHFQTAVTGRTTAILLWCENKSAVWGDKGFAQYEYYPDEKTLQSDINKIQEYYRTSLNETWTSVISVEMAKDADNGQEYVKEYEKYKDRDGNYLITEPWQLFLYYSGLATLSDEMGPNGRYYKFTHSYDLKNIPAKKADRTGDKFKNKLIDYAYAAKFMEQEQATKDYKNNLSGVLRSYPVNVYMSDYLLADVKHREFKGEMKVKTVRGIRIETMSTIPEQADDGTVTNKTLTDADGNPKSYEVLHITINGVDPKAKQNFAFTVAPGHHYSTPAAWDRAKKDDEYFGVEFSNPEFMDSVRVKQLPLGAGPFMAAKSEGGVAKEKSQFFGSNNIVNFEANPNFLLGKPKIKKLRYKVISSTQLYTAIKKGEVDYASPSMKKEDITQLAKDKNILNSEKAENLGYGYIGVSARYIPNIYIRKAIMTTLDPELSISSYYGDNGGSVIYRPMSKTLTDYYNKEWDSNPYYEFDPTGKKALEYLKAGGCDIKNGVMVDENGKKLKYTFTIAGDSDDHPANDMLKQSAEILNNICKCEITLTHDSMALSKLSSGLLTVWAAAWSSSSDPDMYQVYHKDSQATSTTAWGYKYIFSSEYKDLKVNPDHYDQRQMITVLSDRIDDGRETDNVDERRAIYSVSTSEKKCAMDMLMDLAVEFPTYQRKVYYIWRKGVFNEKTLIRGNDVTSYQSPLGRIWEVEIIKKAK